jgi:hypothetical protein
MAEGYVPCTRCLRQYLKTSLKGKPGDQVDEDADADAKDERGEVLSVAGH